ncbi:uncharacterized protein LOC144124488 [Amblyomma americanum]
MERSTVISVVSDGAGSNRSMWQHMEISGNIASPCHKIQHPCLPEGKYLHFMCDIPHIVKLVRNLLLKHRYCQAGDYSIDFSHYQLRFETERKNHLNRSSINCAHVQPTNLQRMNVRRLAVQLFSRSTAIGLQVYRAEAFTRRMNDLFDALNRKHPAEGIQVN